MNTIDSWEAEAKDHNQLCARSWYPDSEIEETIEMIRGMEETRSCAGNRILALIDLVRKKDEQLKVLRDAFANGHAVTAEIIVNKALALTGKLK